MRSSSSSDEVAALLVPKFQGDKVAYDEFNGASFSGTIRKSRSYGGLMGNSFGNPGRILPQSRSSS
uniref:Uncharacterized protein n=1 Tax=Brassica oleracea TaxID=3712 RepID=A0A3P6FGC8_BRAOL|nr:unnamed protein product [Brassica oleracea]